MGRLYTTNISSVDALWALIQGQTQSVKDALYKRMEEANRQRKTLQQQQYVSKSLKRAFAELEEARTANMELPDATDLFKLILLSQEISASQKSKALRAEIFPQKISS